MTAPRVAQALAIVQDIRDALDAAGLHDVLATIDAAQVPSGARHGIVVVAAPRLTFEGSFQSVQAAFELHVIAGTITDYLGSWDRIDSIIQALVDGNLNLRDGEAGGYDAMNGDPIPCYTLTLNDLD